MKVISGLFGSGSDRGGNDAIAEAQKRQMAEQDTQRAELEQGNAALASRLGRSARRGVLSFMETGDAGLKSVLGG